jgi:exopolysaccharide production protein ExoQ
MRVLARHFDQLAVFILLIISEGVFWPPEAYFSGAPDQVPTSDPYSTAFNAVLIAFLAVACLVRADTVGPLLRSAWPMLPLLALAYLSAYWSPAPDVVLLRATKIAATAMFGIYLLSRGDMANLVALFVKANLVAVAASFLVAAVAPGLALSTNTEYLRAWRGAFTDKNELGMITALGTLFAIYAFRNRYGSRWLSGVAIPANLLLLYLSDSRTPLLLFVICLYVAFFASTLRRRSGAGLAAAFAIGVVGLAGAAIAFGFYDEMLAMLGRNPTLSNRTRIWGVILPYIARRPWLGYGIESFWLPQGVEANQVWAILQWKTPHSHNLWLELCLGLGLVGAALAAFLWASALWRVLRLLLSGAPAPDVVFSLVLLVAIFGDNLAEYAFFRGNDILWLLFAAVFVHLGREVAAARRGSPAPVAAPVQRLPLDAAAYRAVR